MLHVQNEFDPLKRVLLGTAVQNGPQPKLDQLYDPKSREHLLAGTYPAASEIQSELDHFKRRLEAYGVEVIHPEIVLDVNQIYARDIGFVIDQTLVRSNILPLRAKEIQGLDFVWETLTENQKHVLDATVHVEGGDVMPHNDYLFIGYYDAADYSDLITARTNTAAIEALQLAFPHKKVKGFRLTKSNTDPYRNALHLDCCFQPLGRGRLLLHPEGFADLEDLEWIRDHFRSEHICTVNATEMYGMQCNLFSINPEVVVSDPNFGRVNKWLGSQGFYVEKISYSSVAKQEGLFRCTTLPLERKSNSDEI